VVGGNETPEPRPKSEWSRRKILGTTVMAIVIVVAVATPLLYHYLVIENHEIHWQFQPRVFYNYSVEVKYIWSDDSEYSVLVPFPADADGRLMAQALDDLKIDGNGTVANATTEHGEALQITGTGPISITWTLTENAPAPNQEPVLYTHLSMASGPLSNYSISAYLCSSISWVRIEMEFDADYIYGQLGADYYHYGLADSLDQSWNLVPVYYQHLVS
jgi:hypothetical protein